MDLIESQHRELEEVHDGTAEHHHADAVLDEPPTRTSSATTAGRPV